MKFHHNNLFPKHVVRIRTFTRLPFGAMSSGLLALLLISVCLTGLAQDTYNEETLKVKQRFSRNTLEALSEPFVGITSDGEIQPGLFPIRATGVSTEPVTEAAKQFIASLEPAQKVRSVFSVQDWEWRHWSNVANGIFARQGVSLKEMTPNQRKAAMNLMSTSLSARGLKLSLDIMKTDQTLREINNDVLSFDEDLYFFTLMGLPSSSEPWGWQLDGHHLVINYFVLQDQVVMTPVFLGGEPINTTTGKYAGNHILQKEQNLGLELMRSLDPAQKAAASLLSVKTQNHNQAEANKDNLVLDYEGTPVAGFSHQQKTQLLDLIDLFIGNLRDDQASIRMDEIAALLDHSWFAWVGEVADDAVFYYRIHSPVLLIEFDHQFPVGTAHLQAERTPSRDHIHVVIRTPNGNDYGKDLLRQHLENHAH
jgi:hypothetical protein